MVRYTAVVDGTDVAEERRQLEKARAGVEPAPVPAQQRAHRKRVPEIMHARAHGPVWNREPELRHEMVKGLTDGTGADAPAAAEREHRCRRRDRLGRPRPTGEVIAQHHVDARTKGDEAALVELGLSNDQQIAGQIDIPDAQPRHLSDSQSHPIEQREDDPIGLASAHGAALVGQLAGRCRAVGGR